MSVNAFRDVIESILAAHGVADEFRAFKSTKDDAIWSVEITPREGICTFSRPLVIAKESRGRDEVRVGLMFHDVWEVSFDPIVEFHDVPNHGWVPISIYRPHEGQKDCKTEEDVRAVADFCVEWAATLKERGYEVTSQAQVKRIRQQPSVY